MKPSDFVREKTQLEIEISLLKAQLIEKEKALEVLEANRKGHSLTNAEVSRYSRQIIVPDIGVIGQENLKAGSVLIIGCGGLGCPAAQYLAGCGVGRIGLLDYDTVEENNLHRQLLHTEASIGSPKVLSAKDALLKLNSSTVIETYQVLLNSKNALGIVEKYDVVLDASDNAPTRYLINDACVLKNVPLVSGSAVQMEGQLTVYGYRGGPCYRCLFKEPPQPSMVTNCSDAGVLGPVPGVIGVLQALQAVHILLGSDSVLSSQMLLFDGSNSSFRTVKLRGKMKDCIVCGDFPTLTELIDYEQFCGAPANDKNPNLKLLGPSERVSAQELHYLLSSNIPHVLVDVRPPNEFQIGSIPGSINIPLAKLGHTPGKEILLQEIENHSHPSPPNPAKVSVYLVCRRGNDSQIAVTQLKDSFSGTPYEFFDLEGGLYSWADKIDSNFPLY